MKFTRYFHHTRQRPGRRNIRIEWIQRAVEQPLKEETQADGRIRRWTWIPEVRKYLRVVLLADGQTVHNAFYDRDYEEHVDED